MPDEFWNGVSKISPPKIESTPDFEDLGPCVWAFHKPVLAIDMERPGKAVQSFQYVYISVEAEFTPAAFTFLFVGLKHWKIVVHGRNLRPVYDRINEHRVRRIRAVERDFGQDEGKPLISRIEVEDITPKDEES